LPLAALASLAAACSPNSSSAPAAQLSPAGLEQIPLTVQSKSGTHRFTVEVARTSDQQSNGLMNRQSLAPDRGMLFPMEPPRVASFWMHNTLIPLDMIFIRSDGTISSIEANTVPMSLEMVMAKEAVGSVLEIPGGRSAELGIQPGDKVSW
jgi:uncharacterized protein